MTEVKRAYGEGDSVIAVRSLVAPPVDAWDVGVEIPSASRGYIVDVREYKYTRPYVVRFDLGIEISVAEADIAKVQPSLEELPAAAEIPTAVPREIPERPDFLATEARPHHRCGVLHRINGCYFAAGAVVSLFLQPIPTLAIISAVLVAGLLLSLFTGQPFRAPMHDDSPLVRADHAWAVRAVLADIIYGYCLMGLVLLILLQEFTGIPMTAPAWMGGSVFYAVAAVTFTVYLAKDMAHSRAVITIVDTHDE